MIFMEGFERFKKFFNATVVWSVGVALYIVVNSLHELQIIPLPNSILRVVFYVSSILVLVGVGSFLYNRFEYFWYQWKRQK